jgi:hypothetical protein
MPSYLHETFVELFRHRPALAAELLTEPFKLDLPRWRHARLDSGELSELSPTQRHADAVVVLSGADQPEPSKPAAAVVIEVQLRPDDRKRYSWPAYLTSLRARLRCPAMLLVLCADEATARWCATPIEVGHPDWVLQPLVLGPDQTPVVADPQVASTNPELAVLSSIAHANNPEQREPVFEALLAALRATTDEHATLYHDLVLSALPAAARHHLEALMSTGLREYRSDFVRKNVNQGRAEGRVEGRAESKIEAILAVLAARGIGVPDDARARITGCSDLDQLDLWIRRAATADSISDLFT